MNRTQFLTALPAIALITLGACSSSMDDAISDEDQAWRTDARLGEQVDRICFTSTIDSFRSPTRSSVIVEKGVNDEYLIETMGSCPNLDWAQSLTFDTFGSSGCLGRGDSIYAFDSAFGPDNYSMNFRCPISAIYEWNTMPDES